jgi:hypothetical protein
MSSMDDFNKGTAILLDKLYTAFPQQLSLKVSTLDPQADSNTLLNYRDTILFLKREGFIHFDSWANGEPPFFNGVVLTSKGLAILNSTPDALKERGTLGQKLGYALKVGSGEALKTLINQIISGAVSNFM